MRMDVRILYFLTSIFQILTITVNADKKNITTTTLDDVWPTDMPDMENDLEKRSKNSDWSGWSDWSTCSRSCDGGISQQLRRCHAPKGCRGEPLRFKICNMQPCPEVQDFRAHQCSAYDEVPYDGTTYEWTPHYDYTEPCALTCRGRPAHMQDEPAEVETEEGLEEDESSIIVQLSSRVQDGTRCRPGSLDMCIQGKCQRVGCDLKIGSAKKVDGCGVCGGDGASCSQPLYHWETAPMSLCSVTCGGGYKMSRPTCKNRVTGGDVDESLCSAITRPEPAVVQCNTHQCPAKWITDEWGACSKTCGGGWRERAVVCAEESNGVKNNVPDEACRGTKPPMIEACSSQECPKWVARDWSGCSVSCGTGIQVRKIECLDAVGGVSSHCIPQTKPVTTQECTTGISCTSDHSIEDHEKHEDSQGSEQMYYGDEPLYIHHLTHSNLHHDELPPLPVPASLIGNDKLPTEATFIKDPEWSPCSVTCGEGVRRKQYRCKIYLEFSKTTATLNDSQCFGVKPLDEYERCHREACSLAYGYDDSFPSRDNIKVGVQEPGKTYIWREQGYTSCSASCLGGVEELIINCVREDTDKVVSPFLCSPETKPEARIRTCNDRPCPPRWNYSDYSPCSKSCGIGIKTREVQCIHEVTRGGENTMIVPNNMCPQPTPPDRQYCNVLDCPVRWEVSEWSKCSKSCGGGNKERRVECKQIMAQEHKVERPVSMCPNQRPPDRKACNAKPCAPEEQNPTITLDKSTSIQHDVKKMNVVLRIGGAATVFLGTQVKIRCPVKKYNRTKIRWSKDHNFLGKTKKFKISKKGALRILDVVYRDAGIYRCHAGQSSAELRLTVKPKPGDPQPIKVDYGNEDDDSEEDQSSGSHPAFSTSNDRKENDRNENDRTNQKNRQRERNRERNRNKQKSENIGRADKVSDSEDPLNGDSPQTAASSSASRITPTMPHFQQLLSNLQAFSNSQGHQFLIENGMKYGLDVEPLESESVAGLSPQQLSTSNDQGVLLGQGSRDEVTFEWMIRPWASCSQSCGKEAGIRLRRVNCVVRLKNATQSVENNLCEDAGHKLPETVEKCGHVECPKWVVGDWEKCSRMRCLKKKTALQARPVACSFGNGTSSDSCDGEQPLATRECFNTQCVAEWRTTPWSPCSKRCNTSGVKFRITQCYWKGTDRAANDVCSNFFKPASSKKCKGPPCISNYADCKDTAPYCNFVKEMGLCRLHRQQQMCCKTCSQVYALH